MLHYLTKPFEHVHWCRSNKRMSEFENICFWLVVFSHKILPNIYEIQFIWNQNIIENHLFWSPLCSKWLIVVLTEAPPGLVLAVFIFLQSESTHPNWLLDGAMVCWCAVIIISVQYPLLMSSVFLHMLEKNFPKSNCSSSGKQVNIHWSRLSPEVVMSSIVVSGVNVSCVSPLLRWDYNWMLVRLRSGL